MEELIQGTLEAGYYGKHQGIITANELIALAGITEGITKDDAHTDANADITWLKFSHKNKNLFIADRTIHYSASWDHLNSLDLVFGKLIEIDGQKYLLRLIYGANSNPASMAGGANSNDEWDSLIVQFTPDTNDSHWYFSDDVNAGLIGVYTLTQNTYELDKNKRIFRGGSSVNNISAINSSYISKYYGYRPVLEVIPKATLPDMITNRTVGAKYNFIDLNRVEIAFEYLQERLNNEFGFNLSLTIKTDWTRNDLGQLGAQALMEQYRQNVVDIRAAIIQKASTPQTPDSMRFLTYEQVNDIEKILVDVEDSLNRMVNTFFYSNEVTSGEG